MKRHTFLALICGLILTLAACNFPASPSSPNPVATLEKLGSQLEELSTLVPEEAAPEQETLVPEENIPESLLAATPTATLASTKQLSTLNPSPTPTLLPTAVPVVLYPYHVQEGTPAAVPNFLFPEKGCDWTGVAGQVFGKGGVPVPDLVVEVSGVVGGKEILKLGLTGDAPSLGPGGYALTLGDAPFDSARELQIQVLDLEGKELSPMIPFDTYGDCQKNLIVMNFVRERAPSVQYLPYVIYQSYMQTIYLPLLPDGRSVQR